MAKNNDGPRNGQRLAKRAEKGGGVIKRQCGSHIVVETPNHSIVSIPAHRELGTGIYLKCVKMLMAGGVVSFFGCVLFQFVSRMM